MDEKSQQRKNKLLAAAEREKAQLRKLVSDRKEYEREYQQWASKHQKLVHQVAGLKSDLRHAAAMERQTESRALRVDRMISDSKAKIKKAVSLARRIR